MKKLLIAALGACLIGMAAPSVVKADDTTTTAPAAPKKHAHGPSLLKYDANKNGVLDADELDAIKKDYADGKNPGLKKYDTAGDGKLDTDKIKADFDKAVKRKKDKAAAGK